MKKLILKAILAMVLILSFPSYSRVEMEPQNNFDKTTLKELRCLELNIHFEASGEPKLGKIAVGRVTINRSESKLFPSKICDVIKQPYQFSWFPVVKNHHKTKVSSEIKQIAYETFIENKWKNVAKGSLYFQRYDVSYRTNYKERHGDHIFF